MPSRIPVDAPLAAPPKFGLLASIPPENTGDQRWFTADSVIAYSPEGCIEGQTVDPCASNDSLNTEDRTDQVRWHAYVLNVSERCSVVSGTDDGKARVTRLMQMDTERQLGAELWDGNVADAATLPVSGDPWPNTWLADVANVDILTETGPVGLVHGLACLEQYLAQNNGGQQGAIHATAQVVTHWESFRLLRREGNKILTFKDTLVIPSPGYTGTDPNGNVGDNNVWAYATDMPRIFLGPIKSFDLQGSVDTLNNTAVFRAFRPALVEWQRCRHAGVRLAVSLCGIGGS